mmetsp:Transcript_13272/g.27211  ORF Transcript_13272/g.27211 Transcript_13272/m.27211 type:complete len:389 (-) Transcript_13272:336-1502(-)
MEAARDSSEHVYVLPDALDLARVVKVSAADGAPDSVPATPARAYGQSLLLHQVDELRSDLPGLSDALGVQEVLPAPCIVEFVLLCAEVDVEKGEMVRLGDEKFLPCSVGLLLAILGPEEDAGYAQHRDDGQDLVRAVAVLVGEQEHLGKGRIEGKLRHVGSHLGQRPCVVERTEHPELVQRALQRGLRGRTHEIKVQQVLHPKTLEQQHDIAKIRPLYLRHGVLHKLVLELPLGVETEGEAGAGAACAATSLVGVRLGDRCHVQCVHSNLAIKNLELAKAAVYNVLDPVHGQTRLRDVGAHNDLPHSLLSRLEDLGLHVSGELGVHGKDKEGRSPLPERPYLLRDHGANALDVLLARHEDKDVPRPGVEVDLHDLLHGGHDVVLCHLL